MKLEIKTVNFMYRKLLILQHHSLCNCKNYNLLLNKFIFLLQGGLLIQIVDDILD